MSVGYTIIFIVWGMLHMKYIKPFRKELYVLAISLYNAVMRFCFIYFVTLDWSLGNWTEWNSFYPSCVLYYTENQSYWWHHFDSKPQPWWTQWRFWYQIQYFKWRLVNRSLLLTRLEDTHWLFSYYSSSRLDISCQICLRLSDWLLGWRRNEGKSGRKLSIYAAL